MQFFFAQSVFQNKFKQVNPMYLNQPEKYDQFKKKMDFKFHFYY